MFGFKGRKKIEELEKEKIELSAQVRILQEQLSNSNIVNVDQIVYSGERKLYGDLREVMGKVRMLPLGKEGARVGKLPDGTNIVESEQGEISFALPIPVSGTLEVKSGSSIGALTTTRKKNEST